MAKIFKAWVESHTRADGIEFYTAHLTFKSTFLWFIPYFYTHHVCLIWSKTETLPEMYALCSKNSYHDPHRFMSRQEAEDQLMNEIDKILDNEQEKIKAKIVKTQKEYLPLCPVNDDRGVFVDLDH